MYQHLFTHDALWFLRVLHPEMKVKLALDGADAVDAGFTAHLKILYALRKSFWSRHAPWRQHRILPQLFHVPFQLRGGKSAQEFVAQHRESRGWSSGSWCGKLKSFSLAGRRFAPPHGSGFAKGDQCVLRRTASFLIVAVVKSAHTTVWYFFIFLGHSHFCWQEWESVKCL